MKKIFIENRHFLQQLNSFLSDMQEYKLISELNIFCFPRLKFNQLFRKCSAPALIAIWLEHIDI